MEFGFCLIPQGALECELYHRVGLTLSQDGQHLRIWRSRGAAGGTVYWEGLLFG